MDLQESPTIPWWTSPKPRGLCSGERGRLMEGGEQSGAGMDYGPVVLRKPTPSRPQPPSFPKRTSADALSLMTGFGGGGSGNYEADRSSFTHMLAMSSPPAEDGREDVSGQGHRTLGSRGGSFCERLAARGTANKDLDVGGGVVGSGGSHVANFQAKVSPPARISTPQSSYQLTIPPGLSPTQLLESPVFLNSHAAEPSPTTGTFPLPPYLPESSNDRGNEQGSTPSFVFKPSPKPVSRNSSPPFARMPSQPFSQFSHTQPQSSEQSGPSAMMPSSKGLSGPGVNLNPGNPPVAVPLNMPSVQHPRQPQQQPPERLQSQSPEQEPPFQVEKPSEDGYNWRKYGQKVVKGSEYPRSYYKCTNQNCPMKKKVERSHDGQVTEIVYKGEHNHPKPQPTRRLAVAAAHLISDGSGGDRTDGDGNDWGGFATGSGGGDGGSGYYGAEDPSSSRNRTLGLSLGASNGAEPSSSSSDEDESKSLTEDGDDDEHDSKRRKKEKRLEKELPPAPRTIKEPRVVVQTQSDVDILDDGYRWRKYGQKVVKGNPHPRSYYKCTYLNCPVRKHVERASNDPKAVITTYEGKHNHDVPVARNSSHDNAGFGAGHAPPPSGPSQGLPTSLPPPPPAPQATYQQSDRFPRRSLSSQSVFGRLLDDGSNRADAGASETDLGIGVGPGMRSMDGSTHSHHPQHGGNMDAPSTNISMNLSASLGGARPMEPYGGGQSHGHGMQDSSGLRPKQEQDDSHNHNNVLQPGVYHHHHQRLVLGGRLE